MRGKSGWLRAALVIGLVVAPVSARAERVPARATAPGATSSGGVKYKAAGDDDAASPAVDDRSKTSERKKTDGETRDAGVGILGFEGAIGQARGAVSAEGQGAQIGMRFPLVVPDGKFQLNLLFGSRPFQGAMGEARFQGDSRWGNSGRSNGLVGGLWGFELTASRGPAMWFSLIEIPRMHLGVRQASGDSGFELGVRGGLSLIGRYNPDGASRPLGDRLTPGFYAFAYSRHLYASWDSRAFTSMSGGRPVWMSEGMFCGVGSEMGACLTSRYFAGNVRPDDGSADRFSTGWQVGLMLGVGERLGVKKD